jgi:hypothetical protein
VPSSRVSAPVPWAVITSMRASESGKPDRQERVNRYDHPRLAFCPGMADMVRWPVLVVSPCPRGGRTPLAPVTNICIK